MRNATMTYQVHERANRVEGVNVLGNRGRRCYVVCAYVERSGGYEATVQIQLCTLKKFTVRKEAEKYWEEYKANNHATP